MPDQRDSNRPSLDRSDGSAPLRVLQSYDPFGWIAKIGLVTPSTNTVTAPEWTMMAPKGIAVHAARATLYGATSPDSYEAMALSAEKAAADLATAEVDIVAFGCTSGTFVCDRDRIAERLAENGQCPATTTSHAVVAALKALGARRVALATPYVDFVNEREVQFLADEGFEVVSFLGLGLGRTQAERRAMNRIPPQAIFRMALQVNRDDADVVFLSCCALAAAPLLAAIEAELGKPVISSNQATFWHVLRLLRLKTRIAGYGCLLDAF
jgi:arylmalonate decarboxylase